MKKLLALFLTLALLLSVVPMAIGASAAETNDPAYKFLFDAGEQFRTSYDSGREATATIKFDYYLKSGSVKVYGSENGEQKGYLEEGEGSFELSVDSKSFWFAARNSAAAELYIWNVELTQGGSALDFASYTARTTCDFSTITYGEIPFPNVEDEEPEIVGTGDYAIYFDSSISNNFWVTQKDSSHLEIGMEEPNLPAGNTYTVEFDVYSLTLGSNVVFGATTSTWDTTTAIEKGHQVWKNAPANVNEWTHYSFNVTTTADWKGVIFYVIDDADGFTGYIDNLTIKDSQGTVASSFEPTADDISNKSNCASIVELSADVAYAKNPDYAVYIDNSANDIQSNQIWFNLLGMPKLQLPAGKTYTLKFDNYALSTSYKGHLYIPIHSTGGGITGQNWWNTTDTLNGWATQSVTFTIEADKEALAYHTLYVGAGFKGYLDNFRVYDGDTEVAKLEFDASNLGKENSGATVVLLPVDIANAKPCIHVYDNACDATCNLCEEVRGVAGHVYDGSWDTDCNECGAVREVTDYAMYIDNSANTIQSDAIWLNVLGMSKLSLDPGKTYTLKFDNYALLASTSGHMYQPVNSTGTSVTGQNWFSTNDVVNGWATQSIQFTIPAENEALAYHKLHVGAGFKGYLDNFRVYDGDTLVARFEFVANDQESAGATVVELPAEIEYDKNPNYAVLIDNSKGTDFGQLYLNEVGMDHSKTYPVGDYTIKFDFYALKIADNKNIVACMAAAGWSGNAFPGTNGQVWLQIAERINEWQTISFDVTTVKEGQFPNFHIGAGLKGYFDNYQIIDKSTGETLLNFSPVATDVDKVSKEICKVVKVPCDPSETECEHEYDNDCDTTCNLCEEVREVGAHVYENYVSNNDATCTANGTETGTCACGATDTREVADSKLDHTYANYVSNNDATCTANGTETGTCVCGATDTREVADSKLDHTYENYVSNNNATCTSNATETGKCACGAEDTREIADSKLDHVYENYISNNDATCTANGTETGTCACGDKDTREDADSMIDHYYRDEFDAFCDGCDAIREINYPADKVELKEIDGVKYIYVNGRTSVEGLFKVGDDYYCATWGGVVLTGDQYVHFSYCDKAAGRHFYFSEDGKMLDKGFVTGEDGIKRLYVDSRTSVEGLFEVDGKYYLATWGGVVLTDGRYYVTESFAEGIKAGKNFTVNAEGEILDGIVEIDGQKYYYDFGTTVVPGDYDIDGTTYTVTWGGLIVE